MTWCWPLGRVATPSPDTPLPIGVTPAGTTSGGHKAMHWPVQLEWLFVSFDESYSANPLELTRIVPNFEFLTVLTTVAVLALTVEASALMGRLSIPTRPPMSRATGRSRRAKGGRFHGRSLRSVVFNV